MVEQPLNNRSTTEVGGEAGGKCPGLGVVYQEV